MSANERPRVPFSLQFECGYTNSLVVMRFYAGGLVIFESTMALQNLQKASDRSENSRRASPCLYDA